MNSISIQVFITPKKFGREVFTTENNVIFTSGNITCFKFSGYQTLSVVYSWLEGFCQNGYLCRCEITNVKLKTLGEGR